MKRITSALAALLLAGSVVALAAPAQARYDTGWDCPGCRVHP